ncbi:MAG: NAD-dependent epimerase/dehydratase family protein [Planctomycetes bacterium]|nr:NAD-dependent epimerase/dehydratase family protein [Planctomycetota bacterium]
MELSDSRILVTGSSGTIGNCLCEALLERNVDVVGVDIRPNRWNEEVNRRTINIDLRNPEDVKKLPKEFDLVVHFAANARVFKLVENPDLAKDNFLILYNILEFARQNNIKRILFASSREVYGNSGYIIHSEEEAFVKNCESSYTATKIAGEALVHAYEQCYGIEYVIVRFSNVYGRYDYTDRVVPLFISKALKNEDIHVYGRDKILDFTYIEDCADGVVKSLELFETSKNEVYNIATQKGYSIEKVAQLIIELTGSKSKIFYETNRTGEVCRFIADISKAKAVLNYSPQNDLMTGINKTIEWYSPRIEEYEKELSKADIISS